MTCHRFMIWMLLATGLAAGGCHRASSPAPAETLPAVPVQVAPAQARTQPAFEEVMGTVRAGTRATVAAKVSARIVQIPVQIGQEVAAGALLTSLDDAEFQARLTQATAVRDLAERDFARHQELLRDQAVTQAEYDAAQSRLRLAAGRVQEAESMLSETRIVAPFAGVIAQKWADAGDMAIPGKPLLEIDILGDPQMEVPVPESLVGNLALGQTCRVQITAIPEPLSAQVKEIAGASDPQSRTVLVKLSLPKELPVRSGQFGRVFIPAGSQRTLEVPAKAVLRRGQLECVFVVTNQAAQLRLVKTGRPQADAVALVSGVESGELVVVEGTAGLRDGQPVRLEKPGQESVAP